MALSIETLVERDGPACAWCGHTPWRRDLTLEHLVPRSRGGHLVPENVVLACRGCNKRRGARPVDAYVRELLRDGVPVDVEGLRTALGRLLDAHRRVHREAGTRMLGRLRSVDAPARR